ncbi:protein of unknown function [Pararobbsia alpina]
MSAHCKGFFRILTGSAMNFGNIQPMLMQRPVHRYGESSWRFGAKQEIESHACDDSGLSGLGEIAGEL